MYNCLCLCLRHVSIHLLGCTAAHKCTKVKVPDIVISGENDAKDTVGPDSRIHTQKHTIDGRFGVQIHTTNDQANTTYLLTGVLTPEEFKTTYQSQAGPGFRSFIKEYTNIMSELERNLVGRVQRVHEGGFYATTLSNHPISGSLNLTISFPADYLENMENSTVPSVLTWCPEESIWITIDNTCVDEKFVDINYESNTITYSVCNIADYCKQQQGGERVKRQTATKSYSGSQAFVLADTYTSPINTPPYLTSPKHYDLNGTDSYLSIILEGTDDENDVFVMELDTRSSHIGVVQLQTGNILKYEPCDFCSGKDYVKILLKEVASGGITPLQTEVTIQINLNSENNWPNIFVIQEGLDAVALGKAEYVSSENTQSNILFENTTILVMGFDIDNDNLVFANDIALNGTIQLISTFKEPAVLRSCEPASSTKWQELIDNMKEGREVTSIPIPCNVDQNYIEKGGIWMAILLQYTPDQEFHGEEDISVSTQQ